MKNHELYAEQLLTYGYGYALYEPDPKALRDDAFDKVRVGDVGFIDGCGAFIRLFNVFMEPEDEINKNKPPGFYPIDKESRQIRGYADVPNGLMASSSVSEKGGRLHINGTSG